MRIRFIWLFLGSVMVNSLQAQETTRIIHYMDSTYAATPFFANVTLIYLSNFENDQNRSIMNRLIELLGGS